ncbi:hypothetical protein K438DRAFT_1967248 [Mycena galopus ATCC 62051]|nr:hypothetical protein K438DRAFT_1967248 [Mycena galopus ATCC 62051]
MDSDITPAEAFAKSSPPPPPMVLSLWATAIPPPARSIPSAHRNVTPFVPAQTATQTVTPKVDIPPPDLSMVPSITNVLPSTTAAGASSKPRRRVQIEVPAPAAPTVVPAPTPAVVPGPPLAAVPAPPPAAVAHSAPPSPLSSVTDSDSDSDEGVDVIPRPKEASRLTLEALRKHMKVSSSDLAKIQQKLHLDRGNFRSQDKTKLKIFYDAMAKECPILRNYPKNWATSCLLVAHLKSKTANRKIANVRAAQEEAVRAAQEQVLRVAQATVNANPPRRVKTQGRL